MNPIRWVRWKVVAVLAVLGGVAYFLGLDKVALKEINSAGKESKAAKWSVSDFALGLLAGNAQLTDLLVDTPDRGRPQAAAAAASDDDVFNAALAQLDLSMGDLLSRRYFVDRAAMKGPKISVTRREDGTINIEDFGEPDPEAKPPAPGEVRDWFETAKRWYERFQKVREKVPERKPKPPREPGFKADYSRGVTYPFEGRPTYGVREIALEDFEVSFHDDASKAAIPKLTNGKAAIREVTSAPGVQEKPTSFEISGDVAGSTLKLGGTLDLRGQKTVLNLTETDTGELDVKIIEAFVGESLPVKLTSGKVRVSFNSLLVDGVSALRVEPLLTFKGIQLEAKDPGGKIAGLPASQFVAAFNEASKDLSELVIADLRISGSLASPRFEWGDTVKNLVVSGGKAFAMKQAEKGIGVLKGKAAEELDKLRIPGAEGLKEQLKDVKVDDVKKTGEGLLKGIFGGAKSPPPEAPKPEEKK
jgi:hypothetical protein